MHVSMDTAPVEWWSRRREGKNVIAKVAEESFFTELQILSTTEQPEVNRAAPMCEFNVNVKRCAAERENMLWKTWSENRETVKHLRQRDSRGWKRKNLGLEKWGGRETKERRQVERAEQFVCRHSEDGKWDRGQGDASLLRRDCVEEWCSSAPSQSITQRGSPSLELAESSRLSDYFTVLLFYVFLQVKSSTDSENVSCSKRLLNYLWWQHSNLFVTLIIEVTGQHSDVWHLAQSLIFNAFHWVSLKAADG